MIASMRQAAGPQPVPADYVATRHRQGRALSALLRMGVSGSKTSTLGTRR
jgi:hypothetical protein